MKAVLLSFFVVLSLSGSAQKSPIKFGDIPMEDMTMTVYPQDSSAAAVVLADYGEAYLQLMANTSKMAFERHIRIKVLKKEGTQWADAVIPLFKSSGAEETLSNLKACTYNLENGKIVESRISKDAIFREKFNRNIVHQKFTLPDVKVGSVFEYSYRISSDFIVNFPNWEFQRTIPTRRSEYWAIIPNIFTFEKYMQGYLPVTSFEEKRLEVSGLYAHGLHYVSLNVPAFREEPQMTSESDYISKINFALSKINIPGQMVQDVMGSWEKLNALLLQDEDFYGAIKGSGFLKKVVEDVTKGITDPVEKIHAIHTYVKQNVEWNGVKDFYAGNLKKVLEEKKGSSGDINILLASMLNKADIDVDMVLLSTRDHGFVREQYPMVRQFNYVVCLARVGEKTIFLDATGKYLPANVLPMRCLNGRGLVISRSHFGWVGLDTRTKAKTVVTAEFQLNESGALKGELALAHNGYDAVSMRAAFHQKGEEDYVHDWVGSRPWKLAESHFENIEEIHQPAKESYELEIPEYGMVAGDNIYFNPFVTFQIENNPYKSEARVYPVDYGSKIEKVYVCKIKAPEGYVLDQAPESKILMLPGNAARFIYNVAKSAAGDWVSITSDFQINRNIFPQTEYPNLREFYNQVVAIQAEQIVFKKKL